MKKREELIPEKSEDSTMTSNFVLSVLGTNCNNLDEVSLKAEAIYSSLSGKPPFNIADAPVDDPPPNGFIPKLVALLVRQQEELNLLNEYLEEIGKILNHD